jgi:soluble lytic murein transglycosylase-like protein
VSRKAKPARVSRAAPLLRRRSVAISCALALGLATTSATQAAQTNGGAKPAQPKIELLTKPADSFQRAIETQKAEQRYGAAFAHAKKLGVEPSNNLLDAKTATPSALRPAIADLRKRIAKAEREPDFGLAGGVSQQTLDAIAACESGGDPTAVDSSGTYFGLYQFDTGTWASVGGSGSPAAASPEEQSYRASLLYSRAGSSPWPVCGV